MVFEIPIFAVLMIVSIMAIGLVALIIWYSKWRSEKADKVVKAKLIEEVAVYKEKVQNTGFSVGRKGSFRSYYRYKNVLDHYECEFSVVYENGSVGTIKCAKDSDVYNKLIRKTK